MQGAPRVVRDHRALRLPPVAAHVAAAGRQRDQLRGGRVAHQHLLRGRGQRHQAVAVGREDHGVRRAVRQRLLEHV